MGTILIGHKNLVDAAGVTPSCSAAAAGFAAENIQAALPSQKYRTTSAAGSRQIGITGTTAPASLFAFVATNLTQHRSHAKYSRTLDNAVWADTGLAGTPVVAGGDEDPEGGIDTWRLVEDTSLGGHYIEQAITFQNAVGTGSSPTPAAVVVETWAVRRAGADRHLWFRASVGSTTAESVVDLDDGTVQSGSATTAAVTAPTGVTWYRVTMTLDPDPASTAATIRLGHANASYATSYTGSGGDHGLRFYGAHLEAISVSGESDYLTSALTSSVDYPVDNTTDTAGYIHAPVNGGTGGTAGQRFACLAGDLIGRPTTDWYTTVGKDPGLSVDSSIEFADDYLLQVYDSDNLDGYIEVGRVYIGPAWQPSQHTFVGLEVGWSDSGKFRVWRIQLGQQITEAELFGELHDLVRNVQVVGPSKLTETPSGQLVAPDGSKPVVIILDPDETDNPQEQMIYGFITALQTNRSAPVNIGGTLTEAFAVNLTVWEAIA